MTALQGIAAFIVIGIVAFIGAMLFAIHQIDKEEEWW